jgi:sporadic carbohydrate cluster 2OG-Fe(II) oxygenase
MSAPIAFETGFAVIDADDSGYLHTLRSEMFALAKKAFNLTSDDPEAGFNGLHHCIEGMSRGELNTRRVDLIRRITTDCDARELIFKAFERRIVGMLGPDILAQKCCNLVLQPPGDPNPSELHRDAPANSPYEIVMWVPMVDCFASKAMYILDVAATARAFDRLDADPMDWTGFESYAKSQAVRPSVRFGQALVFHTGCLHGSDINGETETRVSLNIRYKSLFAPCGLKNQLQFFDPLRISEVTRLGSILEARELQR